MADPGLLLVTESVSIESSPYPYEHSIPLLPMRRSARGDAPASADIGRVARVSCSANGGSEPARRERGGTPRCGVRRELLLGAGGKPSSFDRKRKLEGGRDVRVWETRLDGVAAEVEAAAPAAVRATGDRSTATLESGRTDDRLSGLERKAASVVLTPRRRSADRKRLGSGDPLEAERLCLLGVEAKAA